MCFKFTLIVDSNKAAVKWPGVPLPAVPNCSDSGFCLASLIKSSKVFIGLLELTAITIGALATNAMGVKSLTASYDNFLYKTT